MLCASAYTASDYAKFGLFRNKVFRWGYFPEAEQYPVDDLMGNKKPASLLWVGRYLDWKHPDDALQAVSHWKEDVPGLELNFIGTGEEEEKLRKLVSDLGLEENVRFLGSMKPEEVRHHMEQAQIFLFTSDRKEGWGAVVNEAMNSGCAVIASDAAGSVPYLIRDDENGLIYGSGDVDALAGQIGYLLRHPGKARQLGIEAYRTIMTMWNADTAAERFLQLAEAAIKGTDLNCLYDSGPCSPAGRRRHRK